MAKRPTKPRAPKAEPALTPLVCDPECNEAAAAEMIGVTVRGLRLLAASGKLPPDVGDVEIYHEQLNSLAALGVALGVSERAAHGYKTRGMPVTADGKYIAAVCRHWRIENIDDAPEWLIRGNAQLPARGATGELVRALLRVLRVELLEAGHRAQQDFEAIIESHVGKDKPTTAGNAADLLALVLAKHFDCWRLTDAEIESLLVENWELV